MKKLLNEMQQAKLKELQLQQAKLNELQAELETLNLKVINHEPLLPKDTMFMNNLGWISTLSISIAAIAASL
jgi:hypothetical protein